MSPNHCHSGVDIKTDGGTGKPVVAAADGYVVRIAVSPGGYGRALYIAPPDGTTTVYGHLERFRTDIESYLRYKRYEQGRSNVDFTCKPSLFPVRAGDTVALSGNSGMSFGPHLHFEVRRSSDQRTLNTLAAKLLPVRDRIAPRIMRLHYVEVDTVQGVPVRSVPWYAAAKGTMRCGRRNPSRSGGAAISSSSARTARTKSTIPSASTA